MNCDSDPERDHTELADLERKRGRLFVLLSLLVSMCGCEKFQLDERMEELCKQDGGVRVFETVQLPPEMFDQNGDPFPGWRKRKTEDRLGSDYLYERTEATLKAGNPIEGEGRLLRIERRVARRADSRVLGTSVVYLRSGGDFIAYAHPTSKVCPATHNDNNLIREIFIRQEL